MRRTRPAAPARTPRPPAADAWRLAAVARPWLAGAVIVGLGQAVLLVAQADVLTRLLAAALYRKLAAPDAAGDCRPGTNPRTATSRGCTAAGCSPWRYGLGG